MCRNHAINIAYLLILELLGGKMSCYIGIEVVLAGENEELSLLKKSILSLTEEERFLITRAYGLFDNEVLSSIELARKLNISEKTINYRKKVIQNKLRSLMAAWAS